MCASMRSVRPPPALCVPKDALSLDLQRRVSFVYPSIDWWPCKCQTLVILCWAKPSLSPAYESWLSIRALAAQSERSADSESTTQAPVQTPSPPLPVPWLFMTICEMGVQADISGILRNSSKEMLFDDIFWKSKTKQHTFSNPHMWKAI